MEEMDREMREGQPPDGFPATEVVVLHEALNAMPVGDTPGRRASVTKYDVAIRMTA